MEKSIESSCFTVLVRDSENEIIDRGTGFFINSEGYFISAGHVFKNTECSFYALLNGEEMPIKEIFKEYVQQDKVDSSIYKDLFIGKLEVNPSSYLVLATNIAQLGTNLKMAGFNRIPAEGIIVSQDDLFDDELMDENSVFFNAYNTVVIGGKMPKINTTNGEWHHIENTYSLKDVGSRVRGISGGPVLYYGTCVGIVNTTKESVTSAYIITVLANKGVTFTGKALENKLF